MTPHPSLLRLSTPKYVSTVLVIPPTPHYPPCQSKPVISCTRRSRTHFWIRYPWSHLKLYPSIPQCNSINSTVFNASWYTVQSPPVFASTRHVILLHFKPELGTDFVGAAPLLSLFLSFFSTSLLSIANCRACLSFPLVSLSYKFHFLIVSLHI